MPEQRNLHPLQPEKKLDMKSKFAQTWNQLLSIFSSKSAQKGYIAGVDQAIISASNFLATVILARYVSPKELGIYAVGFILLRLARVIQEGIIIQPLNTFGASMNNRRFQRYATSTGIIQLLLALGLSAATAFVGWLLLLTGNDTAGPTVFVLWFPILGWQLQEYIRRALYTRGEVIQATLNTIITNSIRIALLVYLANSGDLSGITGLIAIGIGDFIAILFGVWQTRSYWGRQFENILLIWVKNWRFGSWIAGGNILNWLSVEFYPVLAAGIISFAAAGAYRALQNLVAPIHMLLRAIDTYVTPRAARAFKEGGIITLQQILRLSYIVAGIPTLILFAIVLIFPKPLLQLLYGDSYTEYSSGIYLMAIFYLLLYLGWPLQIALKAARNSQPIFIANAVAVVAMFTFGIWAIYQWGVYGTIFGQIVNAVIMTVILYASWKRYSTKWQLSHSGNLNKPAN